MEEWIPLDVSFSLSLSLRLSAYIPLLLGSARPMLPWQQGLVRHGKDYRGRKERKRGKGESTCSPFPAAETLRESSKSDEETRVHPQLPFSHKTYYICPSASTLTCPLVSPPLISILSSFILPFSSPPPAPNSFFPAIFALPTFSLPPFSHLPLFVCPSLFSSSIPPE